MKPWMIGPFIIIAWVIAKLEHKDVSNGVVYFGMILTVIAFAGGMYEKHKINKESDGLLR